jgi:cholest-4-en-3-one 26-monooxygenase
MNRCPVHTLLDFDRFAEGTPRALIAELRAKHRILWETDDYSGGHWLLFRQEDIDHVLKTPALFSNAFSPILDDFPPEVLAEQQKSLTFMDPPGHRKYRALIDHAFRQKALESRRPAMERAAREIVDAVIARGECEFVTEVAMQMPMRVMFELLGVREEDYTRVVHLVNTLSMADDPDFAANRLLGFQASIDLIGFGAQLAADHRLHPRPSMTMEVLEANVDGRALDDGEFGRLFNNLVVGGLETTRNTLALGLHQLILHPEQYRMLEEDPALVPGAVEEFLRHQNTVVYLRRTATQDMAFLGEKIRKGDKLVCVLGSPNRDPAFFPDPERFDITRPAALARKHYRTFGQGGHYCVGVHQARLNLEVMLAEIVKRMGGFRLLAPPRHTRSIFMEGYKEMRVGFEARG